MKANPPSNYLFSRDPSSVFGFLSLLMLVFLFSSSNKDDKPKPSSEYYMKFKANGKQYLIESRSQAGYVSCAFIGETQLGVSGIGTPGPEPALFFRIKSPERITTKEYNLDELTASDPQWAMIATLPIDDVIKKYDYYEGGKEVIVTIKEITTTSVKGTFSGIMVNSDNLKMKITEGEFLAERVD